MGIRAHRAELGKLPPAGRRWRWGDVVGTDDERVAPKAAHAAHPLLDKHGDGRYETTQRLEEYLAEKHGIELTGRCEDQTQLPIDTLPARESAAVVATDGSGATDSATTVQVGFDGEDASDAVAEQDAREGLERNVAAGKTPAEKHQVAERDARQATIDAYAGRVRVGPLARSTGDAYTSPGIRVRVDS